MRTRIAALVLLGTCLNAHPLFAQDEASNPLPPCPDTPGCASDVRSYPVEANELFEVVRRAIHRMTPVDLDVHEDSLRLTAAFRVFFFLDDLTVALERLEVGTQLYVRSASRSGFWDAGTNRRRINGFFERLERLLDEMPDESAGNGTG